MARRPKVEQAAQETRDRLRAMSAVAGKFKDWRPRAEVIRDVEAVPTVFCQYDDVVGVGGHPIGRITLVRGPSNEGKTEFALGLGLSFLRKGHYFGLGDAERTTTAKWVKSLMADAADHPGFQALPIRTYEQVRAAVREYCETIAEARAQSKLPDDMTGLIVIDSIRKLVPKKLWDELSKMGAGDEPEDEDRKGKSKGRRRKREVHVDGFGGRAAQMKAAMNAAWMDELVPLLADTRMSMVLIARETALTDDHSFSNREEDHVKVGGGAALKYEASLEVRTTRDWKRDGDGRVIGERNRLDIIKTKVAGKQESVPSASFHSSNGVLEGTPVGFDPARDLVELGLDLDVLELKGSWINFGDRKLDQGTDRCVRKLYAEPTLFAELDRAVRAVSRARHGIK